MLGSLLFIAVGAFTTIAQDRGAADLNLLARYIESNTDVELRQYRRGQEADTMIFGAMESGTVDVKVVGSTKHLLVIVTGRLKVGTVDRITESTTSHMLLVSKLGSNEYEATYYDEEGKFGPYKGETDSDGLSIRFVHQEENSEDVTTGRLRIRPSSVLEFPAVEFTLETNDKKTRKAPDVRMRFFNRVSDNVRMCQVNIKVIATAVQAHHVRNREDVYFSGEVNEISAGKGGRLAMLGRAPKCPGNESFYFVTGFLKDSFAIRCGDPDHKYRWTDGEFKSGKREG